MWATWPRAVPVVATFHAWLDRSRAYELAGTVPRARCAGGSPRRSPCRSAAARFVARALPGLDPVVIPNGLSVAQVRRRRSRASWPPGRRIAWAHRLDRQKGFPVMVDAFGRWRRGSRRRVAHRRRRRRGPSRDRDAARRTPRPGHDARPSRPRRRAVGAGGRRRGGRGRHRPGELRLLGRRGDGRRGAGRRDRHRGLPGGRRPTGSTRCSCPPATPRALAAAIARVLDDDGLARRLADAGRAAGRLVRLVDRGRPHRGRLPVGARLARRYDRRHVTRHLDRPRARRRRARSPSSGSTTAWCGCAPGPTTGGRRSTCSCGAATT